MILPRSAVVVTLALVGLPAQEADNAGARATAHWRQQLDALGRPDARHGTLGPTGARLWFTHLAARPGCVGQGHYIHHTAELRDPLTLTFTDGQGVAWPLEPAAQQWFPTHNVVEYTVAGQPDARIREERWVTEDDVFVSRLHVRGVERFGLHWDAPLAPRSVAMDRFTVVPTFNRADVDLANAVELAIGDPRAPVWLEGEAPRYQSGSTGPDRKRAASGGEVLGSEFGTMRGHRALYEFYNGVAGTWTVRARYARNAETPARWTASVRGTEIGTLTCAPTGGWGGAENEFAFADLDLGELPVGWVSVQIEAAHDAANTNFDGFWVVRTEDRAAPLPARDTWRGSDPGRGRLLLPPGQSNIRGVPFAVLPPMRAQGVRLGRAPLAIGGTGSELHVLAVPTGAAAVVTCGEASRTLRTRAEIRGPQLVTLPVAAEGALELRGRDCVLVAATRAERRSGTADERRGRATFHGVATEVRAGVHGLPDAASFPVDAEDGRTFHATFELSGNRVPGTATQHALSGTDTLAAHRERYVGWFAANAPRLYSDDPLLMRVWAYRWFLVRHNLAWPQAGNLPSGAIVYEGRHNSWYPRLISFSTPHIVAETRWLADPTIFRANVAAHVRLQQVDGVFPNALVDWKGFRYTNWIPEATVEAFKVHPDRAALAELLPALARNVDGLAATFDGDGDGLLAPGDHYTTGMEFQPSFWAHVGYDNRKPQTQLERPDFNAYQFGNAMAVAQAARHLERGALADAMTARAETTRAAVLRTLWHDEDRFFYSVRESDDSPARCKEVIGFYPFRFGLPPAGEPRYREALAALIDPAQFWTEYPVASCAKTVPVYSAAVQRWPGPGGVVTPCMWNGPTWPHANSLVADAIARVVRAHPDGPLQAGHLGQLLRRFARFHCEDGDPARPLLREYGDGESGVNWGCADYMHSTFNDLLIRHALGLVPRFDKTLEVRPLAVGLGDLRVEDLPYHGHRLTIAVRGDELRIWIDGAPMAPGSVEYGLSLAGFVD